MSNSFDHEKLDVYQVELSFISWVSKLLVEVKGDAQGFYREVCDQLDRASLSCLLNTAEGNGKRQGRQRAKFFDDARGSAVECAACLDALVAKGLTNPERVTEGKALLLRTVGMLTRLVERFDAYRVREDDDGEALRPSLMKSDRPRPSSSSLEGAGKTEDEGREGRRGRNRERRRKRRKE